MENVRGHSFKVRTETPEVYMRGKILFTHRVVIAWNTQPVVVVEAYTMVGFKRFLDRHVDTQVMEK